MNASDTFAQLTREQWATYMNTFVPFENKLIEYATDPGVVTNAMSLAGLGATRAFDQREAGMQRRLAGLGLSLNPDEQRVATRSLGLARSLASVNAQNSARDATLERQQSILGSPAPRLGGPL